MVCAWIYISEGGLLFFMEAIEGNVILVSMQPINTWQQWCVTMGGIMFWINEDVIAQTIQFSTKGNILSRVTMKLDKNSMN